MDTNSTTVAVQQFLDELAERRDAPAEPVVRDLLARAATRLRWLAGAMLNRSYPRLTKPPLSLQSDEMVGAIVERLLKAMRVVRPGTVRQFFALANQHVRWELNAVARRLDHEPRAVPLPQSDVAEPVPTGAPMAAANSRRILAAIDGLPEDEREVFSLVRIQGLMHDEAAEILGVSTRTVQRRLSRSLLLLARGLRDLCPGAPDLQELSEGG
jgi:RNA polymerase sigma factor (sigma-70 family)